MSAAANNCIVAAVVICRKECSKFMLKIISDSNMFSTIFGMHQVRIWCGLKNR